MGKSNIYAYKKVKDEKGVYKTQKVQLSYRKAKAEVLKIRGWTPSKYQKQYDILKNKVRAYESFKASKGIKYEKQSISELLYKEAVKRKQYGKDYKPSVEMKRILKFSAVSITKGRQLAQTNKAYIEKREKIYKRTTDKAFSELINTNAKAREIADNIADPVKREEALKDYAEALHTQIDQNGKHSTQAIPSGETFGSDTVVDFDYSDYL